MKTSETSSILFHSFFFFCLTINTVFPQIKLDNKILASFPTPGPSPQGLAWDGEYIWMSDDSTDTIYKLDPQDGSVILSFPSPGPESKGMTSDTTYIWCLDDSLRHIYKLDKETGAALDSIPFPAEVDYMPTADLPFYGVTWDGEYLWISFFAGWSSKILRIDTNAGTVDRSFFCDAEDLAFDGVYLWNVDSQHGAYKGFVKKRDILFGFGNMIAWFRTPGYYPTGLTYDGTYFWLTDCGDDSVYIIQTISNSGQESRRFQEDKVYSPTLFQNYPNPFNNSTIIQYKIDKPTRLCLSVFDIMGKEVKTLAEEMQNGGIYQVQWDGKNEHGEEVSSGLFICILRMEGRSELKRIIKMK